MDGGREEGGDRKGVLEFVCRSGKVMYERVEVKRVAFAEMLMNKFCLVQKMSFYCLSFTFFPNVLPISHPPQIAPPLLFLCALLFSVN